MVHTMYISYISYRIDNRDSELFTMCSQCVHIQGPNRSLTVLTALTVVVRRTLVGRSCEF